MCAICGKATQGGLDPADLSALDRMMSVMRHRGPDDEGVYVSRNVALGHRRLSIIDLNNGKQPVSNEDETIRVVFNGEIYNYLALREDLVGRGHIFRTKTDTEVLVHAYEEYGVDFLQKLRGMFAFAIWDEKERRLLAARDRVGIKPLYYRASGGDLSFASELKALIEDPAVAAELNYPLVDRFLTYLYLPGDETLIKGIHKLPPGHFLLWKDGNISINEYWDLDFPETKTPRGFAEAKERLGELLRESVRLHMISDVPVGLLLSGGVDSTAMLSYAVHETDKDVSTFTVGFENAGFADEREYARLAARRFGTKHYDMTITARDFADFMPKYVWHMEEPVCEPPAVALYYVSRLASGHVKVLISGEGGDEAFAGYSNYRNLLWFERLKKAIGPFAKLGTALFDAMGSLKATRRIQKYAPLMSVPFDSYYLSRTSNPYSFFNRSNAELYTKDFLSAIDKVHSIRPTTALLEQLPSRDLLDRMLYIDTKSWLPDDLLVKADKMTMANSVELRVPLLDHEILEFAASLPSSYKVHGFSMKHILKETLGDSIPQEIIKRKKAGFPVPYNTWIRNGSLEFIREVLLDDRSQSRGYFRKETVERLLRANSNGSDYSKEIFSLLVLELWFRLFIDRDRNSPADSRENRSRLSETADCGVRISGPGSP